MMHPDDYEKVVRMLRFLVLAAVALFAFRCGQATYHIIFDPI
jgi:hypothetical protein